MRFKYFLFFCFVSFSLVAQDNQRIGDWRSYLPYVDGKWVTQSSDKIYYATGLSIFSIEKADLDNWDFMSKVEGLSDIGANRVEYDDFNNQLIVVYENSNIDIIIDGEVINLPNIKENQNLTGSRAINDIHIYDEASLFFATAFGIVELSTENIEFGSTIFTGIAINDITSIGTNIYASTDEGIYTVDLAETNNNADFSAWTFFGTAVGLPSIYEASAIESFNDKLYAVVDNNLYHQESGGQFSKIDLTGFEDFDLKYLSTGNGRLLVGLQEGNFDGRILFLDALNSFLEGDKKCTAVPLYAIEDEQGRIWFADEFSDIRYGDSDFGPCNKRRANSPTTESASDIAVQNDKVYVASGGTKENFSPLTNNAGFYILENNNWDLFDRNTVDLISDFDLKNMYQIEPHPQDSRVFVASYWEGLLEYNPETGEGIRYGSDGQSTLTGTIGDSDRERVSGLCFDQNNNLWINNYGAENPLHVLTPEGQWYAFNPDGGNELVKVVVDQNGYTWSVLAGDGGGVVVHDAKGSFDNIEDHETRFINNSNSEIVTGVINTIAVDLDGEIWVGTNQGPVVFDSGASIFDNSTRGSRRQVLEDSIPAILLETENIRAIEFDGANRKWFGTGNGIFVQSPDGKIQELHFNTDNSPLFSNVIDALEFDDKNGIMYISTQKGLQSYKTATLGSQKAHARVVYAYPNPVRPDYQGPIAIKGLARDANVKITDLNGKLVFETQSLGGQAIWDGRDYTGRKAATGVYLVFSTGSVSFDTPDSYVTKIMVIN